VIVAEESQLSLGVEPALTGERGSRELVDADEDDGRND
jgi:hypothetical protein